MLKVVGVSEKTWGLYFCIKDEGVDDSLEFASEFEIKQYLASDLINIDGVSLDSNNNLVYSEDLVIADISNSSDEGLTEFEDDDEDFEDEDDISDDYDISDDDYDDEESGLDLDDEYEDDELEVSDDDTSDFDDEEGLDLEDDEEYEDIYNLMEDDDDDSSFVTALYNMLDDTQVDLLKRYYMWYAQRTFSKAQKEANKDYSFTLNITKKIQYREDKKNYLNKLRSGSQWHYAGFVAYKNTGDITCEMGHNLKNAHIAWKVDDVSEDIEQEIFNQISFGRNANTNIDNIIYDNRLEGKCLVFGIKCVGDFFEIPPEGIEIIQKAQREAIKDMKLMYEIMISDSKEEAIKSFGIGDSLFTEFEALDLFSQLIGQGRLFKYDKLMSFYKEFRGINGANKTPMLPPKSLVQELRDSLLGWNGHNFKGELLHLGKNSKLYDYLDKLYQGNFQPMKNNIFGDKYSYRRFSKINDFSRAYLEVLFTYEICGFYKYRAVSHRTELANLKSQKVNIGKTNEELEEMLKGTFFSDDEGGASQKVKWELEYLYSSVLNNRYIKDVEFSKGYLDKLVDYHASYIDRDKVIEEFNEIVKKCYLFSDSTIRAYTLADFFNRYSKDSSDYEISPLVHLLSGDGYESDISSEKDALKIDAYISYMKTIKALVDKYKPIIAKYCDELNEKEEQYRKAREEEERRLAEEERKRKEEEQRKREEEEKQKEEELRKSQEAANQKQVRIQNNLDKFNTKEGVVAFLASEDMSGVSQSEIKSIDFMRNVLNTVHSKQNDSPTYNQWRYLKGLFESYTGLKYTGEEADKPVIEKKPVDKDVLDKLKHLVSNRDSLAKEDESRLFDIITTVSKTGEASVKQQKYVDEAVKLFNERVK